MPRVSNRNSPIQPELSLPVELGPALDFMRGLWRLNHAIELTSGHMERTIGITAQQRMIIRCIGKRPGISPSQLASLLHLDRSTISSALRRMEQNKLLTRQCDDQDRRSVTLWLSNSGKKLDQPSSETLEHAVECMLKRTGTRDRLAASQVMECLALELELIISGAKSTSNQPIPRRNRAVTRK
jgi:DNA-binding MarR family transcriptional regulator